MTGRRRTGESSSALRAIGLPQPVAVRTDPDGLPSAVSRRVNRGARPSWVRVESVEEVWRVAEAWWREEPQARTYYRLMMEDGRLLTLFHDDEHDRWAEQRYGGG